MKATDNCIALLPHQQPPTGDREIWVIEGGPGTSKTFAGARQVNQWALCGDRDTRIIVMGIDVWHVRKVMVEGVSGIMATAYEDFMPESRPSKGTLEWPNGARAILVGSRTPEATLGCRGGCAWIDEFNRFDQREAVWDYVIQALQPDMPGPRPRIVITTRPEYSVYRKIIADPETTYRLVGDFPNPHLARSVP